MTTTLPPALLLDATVIDDPYEFYGRLRETAPVWEIAGTDVFAVSSFELVAEATSRIDDFSSNLMCLLYRDDDGMPCRLAFGDAGGQALATADPPLHGLHRGAVFPELVARRMAELAPDVVDLAETCVARALGDETVEFMTAIGNAVPITIISRLIGFRDSDPELLLRTAFDTTAMLGATLTFDEVMQLIARTAETMKWIDERMSTALTDPRDDLLGAVARAVNAGVLDRSEANGILITLLSAGGESTTGLLGNAVRILAERPELQQQLREDPGQIPVFIEEVLRLESPFRFHMRSAPHDTTLGGVPIPAGATVLLLWGAANRDAAEFERPDDIDLGRAMPRHHVTFGRGIHHCVGAPLARVEARAVLTVLLERTASFSLDESRPPRWVNSLMVRRHESLPLRVIAR